MGTYAAEYMSGTTFIAASVVGMVVIGFAVIPRVIARTGGDAKKREKERCLVHSIVCTELGLGLCSIASLNPSLSVGLALLYVPPFLFWLRKRESLVFNVTQKIVVGVLIQPAVLMCIFGGGLGSAGGVVDEMRFNSVVFGSWVWGLWAWVCAVVMGAQVLVVM
jgi:hypothetical protein